MDWDAKPAIGYIYKAMYEAKEQIKTNFPASQEKIYEPIWDISGKRLDMRLRRPLHAAGYYLNLSFFFF